MKNRAPGKEENTTQKAEFPKRGGAALWCLRTPRLENHDLEPEDVCKEREGEGM